LIRTKDARGAYVGITGISYTKDGKMVFGGCLDGSLQGFSTKYNMHRPEMLIRDAHAPTEEYSSIVSFEDGQKIATRNTDGTLKIWDLRKINKPIFHER
jgi:WD40 repeat protein